MEQEKLEDTVSATVQMCIRNGTFVGTTENNQHYCTLKPYEGYWNALSCPYQAIPPIDEHGRKAYKCTRE